MILLSHHQSTPSAEDAAKKAAEDKKGAKPAAAAPAAAAAAKKGAPVVTTDVVEPPRKTDAELEADKHRGADEGLALCAEAWCLLTRAALDIGQLRVAQRSAAAAVNLIPESQARREVRHDFPPCVPVLGCTKWCFVSSFGCAIRPLLVLGYVMMSCAHSRLASCCTAGSRWLSVCGRKPSSSW